MLTAAEICLSARVRASSAAVPPAGYRRSKTHVFQRAQGDGFPDPERPLTIISTMFRFSSGQQM